MVAWEGECKNSRLTVVSSRSGGPSSQFCEVGIRETKDAKHTLSVVLKKLSSKLRAVFFFLDPLTRPHACVGRSSSSRGLRDEEEGGDGRREGRKGRRRRRRRRRRLLFSLSPSSSLISTTLSAAEAERKRERERSRLVPSPSWSMWGKEEKSAQRGKKRGSVPTILRYETRRPIGVRLEPPSSSSLSHCTSSAPSHPAPPLFAPFLGGVGDDDGGGSGHREEEEKET